MMILGDPCVMLFHFLLYALKISIVFLQNVASKLM